MPAKRKTRAARAARKPARSRATARRGAAKAGSARAGSKTTAPKRRRAAAPRAAPARGRARSVTARARSGKRARAGRPAPSTRPLAAKMFVRPGTTVVMLGAPAGYGDVLEPLPEGATVTAELPGAIAFLVLFAADSATLARRLGDVQDRLAPGAVVWIAYPKVEEESGSDLSRDAVWAEAEPFGLRPVAQVAVDEVWSALRFRPER